MDETWFLILLTSLIVLENFQNKRRTSSTVAPSFRLAHRNFSNKTEISLNSDYSRREGIALKQIFFSTIIDALHAVGGFPRGTKPSQSEHRKVNRVPPTFYTLPNNTVSQLKRAAAINKQTILRFIVLFLG